MNKNVLNQNEKNEITNDVKNAFKIAKDNYSISAHKKELILSIIIIIIVFAGCIYFFVNNNPKNIFVNNINSSYKVLTKNINEDDIISLDINYDNNKIIYIKDNKKSIVNFIRDNKSLYIENNKMYLKEANEIYFIGNDKYHLSSNNEKVLTCLKSFKNDFIKTMKDKKVYGNKSNTEINSKAMNVYLVSLKIDDDFKEKLKNELMNDEIFVNAYSKINNITKEEVPSYIQTNIKNIPNKINIYTSLFYHDMLKIELDNLEITKISKDSYNIRYNNNSFNIKLEDGIIITSSQHRIEIKSDKPEKVVQYNTINADNKNYNLADFFE